MTKPCLQEVALKHMENDINEIKACLKEIKADIVMIKISMAQPPRGISWGLATALTILTTACVSLIVFYLTVARGGTNL